MSTGSVHQHTAQIIQFPIGMRLAERKPLAPAVDLEREAAAVAVSDAWYHEAAIQDSKRVGEH
jgi:Protein of unknown function (DUF2735)